MTWLNPDTVIPDLYAEPADYFTWTATTEGSAPANLSVVLRSCTALVAEATAGAWYPVDATTGLPSDTATLAALRDATCIQAAAWVALGVDPLLGGVATLSNGTATTRKIGTAMIVRAESETAAVAAAQQAARTSLVPDAVKLLARRGLLTSEIWTVG